MFSYSNCTEVKSVKKFCKQQKDALGATDSKIIKLFLYLTGECF